jgi:hypothetical protein
MKIQFSSFILHLQYSYSFLIGDHLGLAELYLEALTDIPMDLWHSYPDLGLKTDG